ncbi:MAG TPA: hypothetical protein VGH21_07980 [Solirubrobacteraceae bacterium]
MSLRVAAMTFLAAACCLGTATSASASGMLLSAGAEPLAAATSAEWVSDEFTITTVFGQATCAARGAVRWTSTITPLKGKTAKGKTTYAKYLGTMSGGAPSSGCQEPAGGITITPSSVPWSSTFSNKGIATTKGSKKVALVATFAAFPGVKCVWEASKLISSFGLGGDGAPVPVELSEHSQLFKYDKKQSASICPHEALVSSRFELISGGHTVVGQL